MGNIGFDARIKNGKDEWLTPPEIIEALGSFDLDPCSPVERPWDTASQHYTILDNGLLKPWFGRVWLNPPYGNETGRWMNRIVEHNNGIALIFARTETATFFEYIWGKASALLFLKGRITFYHVNGRKSSYSGGAPSVLIAYGEQNADALGNCGLEGAFICGSAIRPSNQHLQGTPTAWPLQQSLFP